MRYYVSKEYAIALFVTAHFGNFFDVSGRDDDDVIELPEFLDHRLGKLSRFRLQQLKKL